MMKYSFFAACGAVTLASAMTLTAQTPAPPPTPRPQAPAMQPTTRPDPNSVTVTGCLKPWDNTMGAAQGSTGQPGDPMAKPGDPMNKPGATPMPGTRYVLSNVQSDKSASTATAGTQSPAHPRGAEFIVVAGAGVNLAAHVNHQVRVMGAVDRAMTHDSTGQTDRPADKPAARPGEAAPATPAAGAHAGMSGDKKWATLTATSVTMISATCTTSVQ